MAKFEFPLSQFLIVENAPVSVHNLSNTEAAAVAAS